MGTATENDSVPAVVPFGDTSTRAGSLLDTVTWTPPCSDAVRFAFSAACSPAATVWVPPVLTPGAFTVTERTPVELIVTAPGGPVTVTVVSPAPIGSNVSP